jgi:mannose-6-phosphate isomerase-like protein (cupin superfamily)
MTGIDRSGPPATELPAYRGTGTHGWRIEIGEEGEKTEVVAIDAGRVFGGEWAQPQVWRILSGTGTMSWDGSARRIPVRAGDARFFNAGLRHLLIADTPVRLMITSFR